MNINKKKINNIYVISIFILIIILLLFILIGQLLKEKKAALEPITINLLTSVHPKLPWAFKPVKPKISISPGDVTTVEYLVENLGDEESTGIATFAYFPKEYGTYISKINCFCYDARTLKSKQKDTYNLVIFIDPEVTKDSKTNKIKEITMQFIFFDYKEYKKKQD